MDAPFPETMMGDIEKFLAGEPRPRDGKVCEDAYKGDWFPLQRKRELQKMLDVAAKYNPRCVMEIGCDKGAGLYHWTRLPSVQHLIGCEIRGTPYAGLFDKHLKDPIFQLIAGGSRDDKTLNSVRWVLHHVVGDELEQFSNHIDVLFIDGEKAAMFEDFEAYRSMMSSSSVVFIHDINDAPGEYAFNEIRKKYPKLKTERIVDISELAQIHDRESQRLPPADGYEQWMRHWNGRSCGVGVVYIGEPR